MNTVLTTNDLNPSLSATNLQTGLPSSYTEIPQLEDAAQSRHALEQLKANLEQLSDLHARLGFVMREVRTLLKRN